VSSATSGSVVVKKIFEPSSAASAKIALNSPLPPSGPIEISVVAPSDRV
jgi:hypothetical protein